MVEKKQFTLAYTLAAITMIAVSTAGFGHILRLERWPKSGSLEELIYFLIYPGSFMLFFGAIGGFFGRPTTWAFIGLGIFPFVHVLIAAWRSVEV